MVQLYPANADATYQAARRDLLAAEIALRDQIETVAAQRRALPPGPALQPYVFREGPADLSRNGAGDMRDVALADLFAPGQPSLLVIHFMFAAADAKPCPMWSMWADGYDAIARHVAQRVPMVLVARAPIEKLRTFARERGWRHLRLLSSAGNSFNPDFDMETPAGAQLPGVSILTRDDAGAVRHRYTQCALLAPGEGRGIDLLTPVWSLFDLLPEGCGDWLPKHSYMPLNA